MVILSLAVSTSSNSGLPIALSRSRLGLGLAEGVFLRTEYNRNSRFNLGGKEHHWSAVSIVKLTGIRIALLVPSTAGPKRSCQRSRCLRSGVKLKIEVVRKN